MSKIADAQLSPTGLLVPHPAPSRCRRAMLWTVTILSGVGAVVSGTLAGVRGGRDGQGLSDRATRGLTAGAVIGAVGVVCGAFVLCRSRRRVDRPIARLTPLTSRMHHQSSPTEAHSSQAALQLARSASPMALSDEEDDAFDESVFQEVKALGAAWSAVGGSPSIEPAELVAPAERPASPPERPASPEAQVQVRIDAAPLGRPQSSLGWNDGFSLDQEGSSLPGEVEESHDPLDAEPPEEPLMQSLSTIPERILTPAMGSQARYGGEIARDLEPLVLAPDFSFFNPAGTLAQQLHTLADQMLGEWDEEEAEELRTAFESVKSQVAQQTTILERLAGIDSTKPLADRSVAVRQLVQTRSKFLPLQGFISAQVYVRKRSLLDGYGMGVDLELPLGDQLEAARAWRKEADSHERCVAADQLIELIECEM
jgi:hypothetical protein